MLFAEPVWVLAAIPPPSYLADVRLKRPTARLAKRNETPFTKSQRGFGEEASGQNYPLCWAEEQRFDVALQCRNPAPEGNTRRKTRNVLWRQGGGFPERK